MSIIQEIMEHNKSFVENEEYKSFETSKYPKKKLAVLSCMDTRLTLLLPAALGVRNGDIKIIKNAGATISHPYGSVMKSLMVCVYELGIEDILVIGHYDCGMLNLRSDEITKKIIMAGIDEETITKVKAEIDFDKWLSGFEDVEQSVRDTVKIIRNHPLIPERINVYGLVIDPNTGKLNQL